MSSKTQLRPSVCLSFKSPIFTSALASRAWWRLHHQQSSVPAVQVAPQRTPTGRLPERFHSSPRHRLSILFQLPFEVPLVRGDVRLLLVQYSSLYTFLLEVCRRDGGLDCEERQFDQFRDE